MAVGTSAHNFSAPEAVATANVLTRDRLTLVRTMSRSFEANFGGGTGATVDVRYPASLLARRRNLHDATAITTDAITQGGTFPISLSDHVYSAVRLDDADLTLDITDFGRQVLAPQATAVAEDVERIALGVMQGVAETTDIAYDAANPLTALTTVRRRLRNLGLPAEGLYAAVGTQIYADLLNSGALRDASQAGDSQALRNAEVGRVRGFTVVESNSLADDEMIFYGRDSFHLAVRAPIVPQGVSFGAAEASNGFALRWIRDYDANTLADRSVVSTFVGASVVPAVVKNDAGAISTVTPVIRVLASTIPV